MGNSCEAQLGSQKQQIRVTARAAARELKWQRHEEGCDAARLREFKEQLFESCKGHTLRQAFAALGGDVLGRLKREPFERALRELGHWEGEDKAEHLFTLLLRHTRADRRPFILESAFFELFDDEILLQDFWSQLKGKIHCWQVAFRRFDADKDGSISMSEFCALLVHELGYTCEPLILRLGILLGADEGISNDTLHDLWAGNCQGSSRKREPWMPRERERRRMSNSSGDCAWRDRNCCDSSAEESTAASSADDA